MQTGRTLPSRRMVLSSLAAVSAMAVTGAHGEDARWPDHPVRVIVPYPAGGSTDVLTRILAERLKDIFGQPFVIENRAGAGGNIGIAAVTGSAPDGYTIGSATIGHFAINQYLYNKMPYDPERDMVPASLTWELPNVFVVPTDHVPAKTLAEFLTWAKQKGRVSYGSPGWHVATFIRSDVCQANGDRWDSRPVSRRGTDHPGHAGRRRKFCDRQSRLVCARHPVRKNARARRNLRAALADTAGCSHYERSRNQGLRGDIVGSLCVPGGNAASDR